MEATLKRVAYKPTTKRFNGHVVDWNFCVFTDEDGNRYKYAGSVRLETFSGGPASFDIKSEGEDKFGAFAWIKNLRVKKTCKYRT